MFKEELRKLNEARENAKKLYLLRRTGRKRTKIRSLEKWFKENYPEMDISDKRTLEKTRKEIQFEIDLLTVPSFFSAGQQDGGSSETAPRLPRKTPKPCGRTVARA